jgi:hypothetical protein
MISDRKIAANRLNARKSTGPRTARGKARASGNARRHGWSVMRIGQCEISVDVERMAKSICCDDAAPALYEQALIIAECEILLLNLRAARVASMQPDRLAWKLDVRAAQLAAIEQRLATADPLAWEVASWPEAMANALAALAADDLRPAIKLVRRQTRVMRLLTASARESAEAAADHRHRANGGGSLRSITPSPEPSTEPTHKSDGTADESQGTPQRRTEVDAFLYALAELVNFERYERRIMSRRNAAIRMLQATSILGPYLSSAA